MNSSEGRLTAIIPDWLAVTRGAEVPTGLPRDEALRRGRELLDNLRDGRRPTEMKVDEEAKDVLHASVELLRLAEPGTPGSVLEEANGLYHFIQESLWADDLFEERRGLLRDCAEIGWATRGLTLAGVDQRRVTSKTVHDSLADPHTRPQLSISSAAAFETARRYMAMPEKGRTQAVKMKWLSDSEVLLAVCQLLREQFQLSPVGSLSEAAALYHWVSDPLFSVRLFDEREYFLGEASLIAAKAARLVGQLRDAKRWLDLSEAAIGRTVNPAPSVAGVAFERLALRFTSGRFKETLELLPSLKSSFKQLGMDAEIAKTLFLEAVTLRALGRADEHFALLQDLEKAPDVRDCPSLHGQVLVHIGNYEASLGQFEAASRTYEKALPIVMRGKRPVALRELKWSIGDASRGQGSVGKAVQAFRVARNDYQELGFQGFVTQLSLVIAESLLALGRDREAEWEILSTLPAIEEENMVPEGLAAVALLRESVRRRKTDPNALRDLREHLKPLGLVLLRPVSFHAYSLLASELSRLPARDGGLFLSSLRARGIRRATSTRSPRLDGKRLSRLVAFSSRAVVSPIWWKREKGVIIR